MTRSICTLKEFSPGLLLHHRKGAQEAESELHRPELDLGSVNHADAVIWDSTSIRAVAAVVAT